MALKAIIYIRQSTLHQTLTNQESLKLQYALKQRAFELGWQANNIEIIDADLGLTGAEAKHREGFKSLLTQVTLGEVGIILSFDVTRLSRNCSDWYPLLDVCGYRHCLIADRDGVYDPSSMNGRLLLGLKGQLAEVELSTIRTRLTAGLLNKAQRGELALSLPVGLLRNCLNQVEKDPNREVQDSIQRVFNIFLQVKTISQTLAYFNKHGLMMPRYDKFKQLEWRKPTLATLSNVLKNPAYAGTFVYGKTRTSKIGPSVVDKVTRKLPPEQWKIIIPNKYPAYISTDIFDKIANMLKQNYAEYTRNKTRGVPRYGAALLQGIIFCGACGHKMCIQYKGGNRYLCNYLRSQYRTPICQFLSADSIDEYVIKTFFEALSPIELNAYEASLKEKELETQSVLKAQQQKLERLSYQAKLAEAQFNQVAPCNRLVAAELEKRWEQALLALKQAEKIIEEKSKEKYSIEIPDEIKCAFRDIGKQLPTIWNKQALSHKQRKEFLRCLIDKVVVHRQERDTISVRIVWKGGNTTTTSINVRVGSFKELSSSQEIEKKIIELSQKGINDESIAQQLTTEGYRSPMKPYVIPSTVQTIRLKHRL
ncbi:recombinase family protein [Rickettsia endosymbiont of Rhinocyllus conicus]|uniref:recombinase family protein n=1 Tax=Rickettsia endosymbiont of Rhinocyllus conicus TaxID=3066252 RepID=UPI0031335382